MEYVQNYLAERLSETERIAFEDQLLIDPELVRELEASLRLREGLAVLRDRGQLLTRKRRHWRVTAVAAVIAVMILVAAIVQLELRRAPPALPIMSASIAALGDAAEAPLAITGQHTFAILRADSAPTVLDLPARGALDWRVLTSTANVNATYELRLERGHGQAASLVASLSHLTTDVEGFVEAYVDASALTPGEYILVIEPEVENDSSADLGGERFVFQVQRAPGA